ncbi:MAG: type IV pili methyl-accepting chemotaxis transducer N-terminal domain-containing protein, partial [Pseudomonadota bacterium]
MQKKPKGPSQQAAITTTMAKYPDKPGKDHSQRRLDRVLSALSVGYVLALAFIGAIAGTAHVVSGMVIDAQSDNANIVNLSGRQRMLSQRIAMLATEFQRFRSPEVASLLSDSIDLFETSHESITNGDTGNRVEQLPAYVEAVFFEAPYLLDSRARDYIRLARQVHSQEPGLKASLAKLNAMAAAPITDTGSLLDGLNRVVTGFQTKHERQIADMKLIQNIALIILFITLALEAALIFRPLIRRIKTLGTLLNKATVTDPMTNINNRRGFMFRAETIVSQRQQGAL